MSAGIVFVNRGTSDCRNAVRCAKFIEPDFKIISMSLENDPYINLEYAQQICNEENVEHIIIPFKNNFISPINQNIEKAWEYERHFKAVQYQRHILLHERPYGQEFKIVLSSLRGTDSNKKLIEIIEKYIYLNQFVHKDGTILETDISFLFRDVITDQEMINFINEVGIQL